MNKFKNQGKKEDKRWFGLVVLLIGSFILLRRLDLLYFSWHSMWPWVLVAVGLLMGIKSRFRNNASWILMIIGGVNLIPAFTILGVSSTALVLPSILIAVGLVIIFGSSKKKSMSDRCKGWENPVMNEESNLNLEVTFGGRKEVITSKSFRGGTASATFGGVELNLMHADSDVQEINLKLDATFAGFELIVPSHWIVQNNINTTLGSVDDKRTIVTQPNTESTITLNLTGSCTFGGVEIKSY